jgi:hypothetical protein
MTKTAKALDISRYTLIRYLKADEELRNSFDDVKLNEIFCLFFLHHAIDILSS